jgi:hypothetical protein
MSKKVSAFLSASAERTDREIVEWFSSLLKEYNIEPVFAADHPEPRPPQEKIEDFIRKSDMFIAVVTRRDKIKNKKNLWRGPVWVQNEISIAHTLKKPIAVFVEEGVQLEPSIAPFITDCVTFDRHDMVSVGDKAKSFIEALCKKVGSGVSAPIKDETVDNTIVENPAEGLFETVIARTGRAILLWRYGKLNVSLRSFYAFAIVVTLILGYIGYDSIFGTKTLGSTGSVALAVAIIIIVIVAVTESSRCKKCKSYFSKAAASITYGDLKKFADLPKEKVLLKYVCNSCGDTFYHTKERAED